MLDLKDWVDRIQLTKLELDQIRLIVNFMFSLWARPVQQDDRAGALDLLDPVFCWSDGETNYVCV